MKLGTTFAPHHIEWLGLLVDTAFNDLLSLNLDIVRLGCYWSQIEKEPRVYDFSQIESLLTFCEERGQKVVLTVGMKAPRWPEYYLPSWYNSDPTNPETQASCMRFVEITIKQLKKFTCITHWQIENEPLHPSGPNSLTIPTEFLSKEAKLIKQLAGRPVMLTFWGNDIGSPDLEDIKEHVDIYGLDLYYDQFVKRVINSNYYRGPHLHQLQSFLNKHSKPIWITELQAEPWEHSEKSYDLPSPQSNSLEKIIQNISRAKEYNPETILLWGYEYWYYLKEKYKDLRYWEMVKNCFK